MIRCCGLVTRLGVCAIVASLPIAYSTIQSPSAKHEHAVSLIADAIARIEGWQEPYSRVRTLNNPGGLVWNGQPGAYLDAGSGFAHFVSPVIGWQAAQQEIDRKIKQGNNTVRKLSKRWAEDRNYADKLSRATGYGKDMVIP